MIYKLQQIEKIQKTLDKVKTDKKIAIDFLEKKRKQDEETFLQPILDKEQEYVAKMALAQKEIEGMLIEQLESFGSVDKAAYGSIDLKQLLAAYCDLKKYDFKNKKIDKKSRILYDYIIKQGDVESAITYLKYKSGSFLEQDVYNHRRTEYEEKLRNNPTPQQTELSEYVLGRGEGCEDVLKLVDLCARIDAKDTPPGYQGVYQSKQTKDIIIGAAIGEYGRLVLYLYYDGKFGHYDREKTELDKRHALKYREEQAKLLGQEFVKE